MVLPLVSVQGAGAKPGKETAAAPALLATLRIVAAVTVLFRLTTYDLRLPRRPMPILRELTAAETGGVPVKIWTDQIDDNAARQLRALAGSGLVVGHVAAMPDVHAGRGATVGSVFATRDLLLPTAIGADIGCGVLAQPFEVRAIDLSPALLRELHALIKEGIPTGSGQWVAPHDWEGFADDGRYTPAVASSVREKGPYQLGSLGGGNHFIELAREADVDRATARVWLLIHSGSRGVGSAIAAHHIAAARNLTRHLATGTPHDLWPLPFDRPEGAAYLRDLQWAQGYAAENRRRMLATFVTVFARLLKKRLRRDLAYDSGAGFDSVHNFAARETIFGEELWVHRKGATFAGAGAAGVIPGSMATGSYLVRGLGNPASLNSCSHGAGRLMNRGQAARSITLESFARKMAGIIADTGRDLPDEAPHAYKDLDTVLDQQADLVAPIGRLLPLLNVKDSGRWQETASAEPRAKRPAAPRTDRKRDKDSPLQRRKLVQRGRG